MARTVPWRRPRRATPADTSLEETPEGDQPAVASTAVATKPEVEATATADEPDRATESGATEPADSPGNPDEPLRFGDLTAVLLTRAAHPRQALLTAVGVAVAAAISGRALREVVLVLVTVLVGQVGLGWFNDLVDRRRDAHHQPRKPLVTGHLDTGTLWFALAIALFLVVPLSVASGVHAATAYLVSLAASAVGTAWLSLRRGFFSWVPWAVSFALYPAYLSYGGWGGQFDGAAPTVLMTLLGALLGLGAHLLTSLWGLVPDNADGWTYLPLRLGLRLGASRLLAVAVAYVVVVLLAMALVGATLGLSQPPIS